MVDNRGKIVWADQYMLILCSEITKLYDQPKIIMDVKCSKVFFDEAKKMKCNPIMARTGHSPIKEKMKELNSPLSGEMSGHICYADDFFGYDDAMYVALRLLRILSNQSKTLSDIIGKYPATYSTPEIRFDVEEIRKFAIIDEIKERLKNTEGEVINIDGIRVQNKLGWFWYFSRGLDYCDDYNCAYYKFMDYLGPKHERICFGRRLGFNSYCLRKSRC